MEDFTDKTDEVRPGEEFDLDAVKKYLKDKIPELGGEVTVEQFPQGHSNLTYMLKAGGRELVLRRPPFGSKVKSAHDMGREFKVLSALHSRYSKAPKPLAFCEDESVIGAIFYVMERIPGVILRKELPEDMDFSEKIAAGLSRSFIENLAEFHAIDYQAAGLGDLGKPDGFLRRQVHGWSDRYFGSQTDDIPEIDGIIEWIKKEMPESPEPTLVHNDYKYDNLILDPDDITKIIGVLDWELTTIGDPLSDLGGALGYWVQDDDPPEIREVAFGPTDVPGSMTRRELAETYAQITGRDIGNIHYYVSFATFRIAVIVQQIYYRFAKGHTNDERFEPMLDKVKLLARTAQEMIERGEL